MAIILGIIFAVILGIQVPMMLRKKLKKELILYIILMAIAILYSYAAFLEWNIPRPTQIIMQLLKPVAKVIFGEQVE